MNTVSFFLLLSQNLIIFLVILVLICGLYYILFKKFIISVVDPFFLQFVSSLFGFSVVVFLFIMNKIEMYYFSSYVFTQFAFFGGFLLGNKKFSNGKINTDFRIKNENDFSVSLFVMSSIISIVSQLIVYATLGIPILMASRLDLTINAGGFGIFTRFTDIAGTIALFYCFYFLIYKKVEGVFRYYIYFYFVFFAITSVLSGGKSAFLGIGNVLFCFILVNSYSNSSFLKYLRKMEKVIIGLGVIIAIFILGFTRNEGIIQGIIGLVYRFIGSGDIYWHAYPNSVIERLDGTKPLLAIFSSFAGFFRIVPSSEFPKPLGYALAKMFYTITWIEGPNPRLNVFGYVYFGYFGSILYSFFVGILLGKVRYLFFKKVYSAMFSKMCITLLYLKIYSVETDINYFFSLLNNIICVLPVVFFFSFLLFVLMERIRNKRHGILQMS
jgi:hypothetical protein